MGYQMTCHTCSTDAYSIADCWSDDLPAITKDGKFRSHTVYSGGRMYDVCLKQWYKKFTKKDFKKVANLGFRGLHYIDVIKSIYPYQCFSKEHPMNPSEGVEYAKKIAAKAKKNMGEYTRKAASTMLLTWLTVVFGFTQNLWYVQTRD